MNRPKLSLKNIKIIVGSSLGVIAVIFALCFMLVSYGDWKSYYDSIMAEKERQKYLNSLPLELVDIDARLADGVIYYDNDTAEPEASDFVVTANFTEKGRNFSKGLSSDQFTFEIPEGFSLYGGKIVITYVWQPDKTGEDAPMPEPVVKTAELDITLVYPDATVYKMTQVPTYAKEGVAENIEGDRKVLPVLDDVNWEYTEYPKTGLATFVYEELGITVKKTLTDEMSIETADGSVKADLNNVNCHFAARFDNAGLSYDETNKSFVMTVNEGKTLDIARVEVDDFTVVGGTVVMNRTLKLGSLTVRSGASLEISGVDVAMEAEHLLFEEGSNVTLVTANDGILLYGDAGLYGTLNMTRSTGYGGTAIYVQTEKAAIRFGETSKAVVTDYSFTVATFGDGYKDIVMILPYGTQKETTGEGHATNTCWYMQDGERNDIVKFVNSQYPLYNATEITANRGGYIVTKKPTETETGLATAEGKEDIVLPVLGGRDYDFEEKTNGVTVFTHTESGMAFYETIEGERITVSGVTYNKLTIDWADFENVTISYADGVYTVAAAEGKTVEFGSINCGALVVDGKGTLKLTASEGTALTATNLTVKSGASLEIPNASVAIDSSRLLFEAGSTVACRSSNDGMLLRGNAEFYGTFELARGEVGGTGINVLADGVRIEFYDTSRATFTNYDFTIGSWNGNTDIIMILPYGTQKETSGSGNETVTCWYMQDGERNDIVKFVNSAHLFNNATEQTKSRDGYIVTIAPTETETGLATADGKEDIVLPALSDRDYSVAEKDGQIEYTHTATGIKIYAAMGERITIDGTEYNRITVGSLDNENVTISYADGVYTVTVVEGKTVEFGSINCGALVVDGKGTLKLTASEGTALTAAILTVKSGASLEIPNANVAIDSSILLLEAGSTVTCASTGDSIYIRGSAQLFGTLNLAHINAGGTGIYVLADNSKIEFADTSRVTFANYDVAIGNWTGKQGVSISVPEGTKSGEQDETKYWYTGDDTAQRIVSFDKVGAIAVNVSSPL